MQGGTDSSEFRIPDSELEGSLEPRVSGPQPSQLIPVPSGKILFPRRMLYVEAVLYVTVAACAFGLGYLAGRGRSAASKDDAENAEVQKRVPVDGHVLLGPSVGAKRGDQGSVVIVLPDGKAPGKRLPIAGLRPGDPPLAAGDATSSLLAEFGGATARVEASGDFTLFVPSSGRYRILVLSAHATRDGPADQADISELGKYFDSPADLLQRSRYQWMSKDLRRGIGSVEVAFTE